MVDDRDAHHDVARRSLRILDHDVEISAVVEHAGICELELREVLPPSSAIFRDQLIIWESCLRIFVEHAHVRVRRRAVEVPPKLLDILPVVTLAVSQAEHALLEDRVAPVPQGEPQAPELVLVAEAGDAVLTPPIGA